ncbi:hypothetical protein [Vibrio rotiferianus]|uniref:hypothetical protein n=1 Tax=Vibrio rotiferianus TaxID=190895 RepID=UPI0005EE23CE|nr:hypothetical protein [Vibrio rotiferianus]
MTKRNHSYLAFLLSVLAICASIFTGTVQVSKAYDLKINEQAKVNYRQTFSQEKWDGLKAVRDNWNSNFKDETSSEGSLFKLVTTIDIDKSGLEVDTSKVARAKTKIVNQNGVNVGLSSTCITNAEKSFVIEGHSISVLVKGLTMLEARKDISFSKAEIFNRGGLPTLKMYDFCVLMRV